jgi:hypothetical protein
MNLQRSIVAVAGTLLLCGASAAAFAGSHSKYHLTISDANILDGTPLEPGDYTIQVANHQATFETDGHVVATAPCSWRQLRAKAQDTEVLTTHNRIMELQFAGKRQALDFGSASKAVSHGGE